MRRAEGRCAQAKLRATVRASAGVGRFAGARVSRELARADSRVRSCRNRAGQLATSALQARNRFAIRPATPLNTPMRRALCWSLCIFLSVVGGAVAHAESKDDAARAYEGLWVGEITAPNARAELGLAFTHTPDGLLVSINFPAMFLHSVNFGVAELRGPVFTLRPLDLTLTLEGEELRGTFAPAKLPVHLRRGTAFPPPPVEPAYPPAPAPAWTRSLGAGVWASPAADADTVYVAALDGSVHAVRASDGNLVWTWIGTHALHGAPLVTAEAIFLVDTRYELVALTRTDGTLRWRKPLLGSATPPPDRDPTFNRRFVSPVIDAKGILYVGAADGGLHAIRASDGRQIWRHEAGAPIHAAAAIDGHDLLVGCFDGAVFALNRRTRKESMRTKLGGPVVSAPVVTGNRIVVGARDYLLYGLSRTGETAWRNSFWFSWIESTPRLADGVLYIGGSDYRRVSALDPATGVQLWATDVGGLSWGTPVVTPQTVYAATVGQDLEGTVLKHTGSMVALDRRTGAPRWRFAAPAGTGGFSGFAGSLVLVGELVIGATVDGTLVALPASVASPTSPAKVASPASAH